MYPRCQNFTTSIAINYIISLYLNKVFNHCKYCSHYCHCREQQQGVDCFCSLGMLKLGVACTCSLGLLILGSYSSLSLSLSEMNSCFLRSFRISSRFSSRCTPLSSDVFWVFLANAIVAILSSVFEPNDDKYNNDYKTPFNIKQNFWKSLIPWLS